ncbi:MAG: SulP family inorganic anion transporter [Flavobacteriales bacterium]|nr:SulP family inorganic anion transporter [Flavobacteriales bacterium]
MDQNETKLTPLEGLAGFKKHFVADFSAGFSVFLLALPLSLGIAAASNFPPIMGVFSAIIGGVFASFLSGSHLSIKGPAAGLIVIVAGAVEAFGGGVEGWKLSLGAMVVAGLLQVLFGLLKLGRLVSIFPLSVIQGMLAAIGLVIIAKQFPVLLNIDPELLQGKGPISLFLNFPGYIQNLDPKVSCIGALSLLIMLLWPRIKLAYLKIIPAPLLVLFVAIPLGLWMNLGSESPAYTLLSIGNLAEEVSWNVDFSGLSRPGIFIKYVLLLALVGSLESLLTVKAIDIMDPYERESDPNKDLIAIGLGNSIAALFGGLPMISEIARSSANVNQGAKSTWANFWHGAVLLLFVLLAYPLLEMIPNAALAAMLIAVGLRLVNPKGLANIYQLGLDHLAAFFLTIILTLVEDLLLGIASGMVLLAITKRLKKG